MLKAEERNAQIEISLSYTAVFLNLCETAAR